MTKKRILEAVTPEGQTDVYLPQSNPVDFNLAQDYSHQHIEQVTHDFLLSDEIEITGFECAIAGGGLSPIVMTVAAPGRVYSGDGLSFELLADAELTLDAGDNEPRIDLIYARRDENVAAALAVRPYSRMRTASEYNAGTVIPLTPLNHAQERHNRITVGIRKGTPGASPSPPALSANEEGLYYVHVGKLVTVIRAANVVDIRGRLDSLRTLNDDLKSTRTALAGLRKQVEALPGEIEVKLAQLFGADISLLEAIASLHNRIDRFSLPEVIRPKLARWHEDQGKISAEGGVDGSIPVVNIELNTKIMFGDGEVVLSPKRFVDKTRLPRFTQVSGGAASIKREQAINLATITDVQSDGGGDFVLRSSYLPVKRSRAACAGRGNNLVEVFGGLAENNSSLLGDWRTYDIENDTLTLRTLTGVALPSADRPYLFSCGSPDVVLLCAAQSGITNPRWFRVNATTGVVAEHTGTKPSGNWFFGDYIAPGKVFIIAVNQLTDSTQNSAFWVYDVDTGAFTEVGVTGNIPLCQRDLSAGCYYRNNEFVLVEFEAGVAASGKTYIFNLPSLTWTQLSIAAPYGGTIHEQSALSRFRMANVGGRPVLIGALLAHELDASRARAWELTLGDYQLLGDSSTKRPRWSYFDTDMPPVQDPAFCSSIDEALGGPPDGRAFVFGGQTQYVEARGAIYASVQGGLIATTLDGAEGVTLADSSSFASFVLPVYTLPSWAVAGYVASLEGSYSRGQVKLEVSFDGGTDFYEIKPDEFFAVTDSSTPGVRHMRITLYSYKTSKPILSKLHEMIDQNGIQVEERMVLRFNAVTAGVRGLYVDRFGWIRVESAIVPSTPDKALLARITPTGSTTAPDIKLYVNQRNAKRLYRGTATGGLEEVESDLAVDARYVRAYGVRAADDVLYDVAAPEFGFDDVTTLTGVTDGDGYILEVEG